MNYGQGEETMKRSVLAVLISAMLISCTARHVVIDPEEVSKRHETQWRVTREPGGANQSEPRP